MGDGTGLRYRHSASQDFGHMKLKYHNEFTTDSTVSPDREIVFVKLAILNSIYFGGIIMGTGDGECNAEGMISYCRWPNAGSRVDDVS